MKLSNIKKNKIHFHIFDTCTFSITYERINDYSYFFIENWRSFIELLIFYR